MGKNTVVTCQLCGQEMSKGTEAFSNAYKLKLKNRGGNSAFLCENCAKMQLSYYCKNDKIYGTPKVNGETFSIELESNIDTPEARVELFHKGYIPTHDCTVEVEFKSPIYNGFNALSKHIDSIEALVNDGFLDLNNDDCGCHCHIGTFTEKEKEILQEYWKKLFLSSESYMKFHEEIVVDFFGRYFDGYCTSIFDDDGITRYNWISCCSSAPTIELRLPKFINAKQYRNCIKYLRKVAKVLHEFCELSEIQRANDRNHWSKYTSQLERILKNCIYNRNK